MATGAYSLKYQWALRQQLEQEQERIVQQRNEAHALARKLAKETEKRRRAALARRMQQRQAEEQKRLALLNLPRSRPWSAPTYRTRGGGKIHVSQSPVGRVLYRSITPQQHSVRQYDGLQHDDDLRFQGSDSDSVLGNDTTALMDRMYAVPRQPHQLEPLRHTSTSSAVPSRSASPVRPRSAAPTYSAHRPTTPSAQPSLRLQQQPRIQTPPQPQPQPQQQHLLLRSEHQAAPLKSKDPSVWTHRPPSSAQAARSAERPQRYLDDSSDSDDDTWNHAFARPNTSMSSRPSTGMSSRPRSARRLHAPTYGVFKDRQVRVVRASHVEILDTTASDHQSLLCAMQAAQQVDGIQDIVDLSPLGAEFGSRDEPPNPVLHAPYERQSGWARSSRSASRASDRIEADGADPDAEPFPRARSSVTDALALPSTLVSGSNVSGTGSGSANGSGHGSGHGSRSGGSSAHGGDGHAGASPSGSLSSGSAFTPIPPSTEPPITQASRIRASHHGAAARNERSPNTANSGSTGSIPSKLASPDAKRRPRSASTGAARTSETPDAAATAHVNSAGAISGSSSTSSRSGSQLALGSRTKASSSSDAGLAPQGTPNVHSHGQTSQGQQPASTGGTSAASHSRQLSAARSKDMLPFQVSSTINEEDDDDALLKRLPPGSPATRIMSRALSSEHNDAAMPDTKWLDNIQKILKGEESFSLEGALNKIAAQRSDDKKMETQRRRRSSSLSSRPTDKKSKPVVAGPQRACSTTTVGAEEDQPSSTPNSCTTPTNPPTISVSSISESTSVLQQATAMSMSPMDSQSQTVGGRIKTVGSRGGSRELHQRGSRFSSSSSLPPGSPLAGEPISPPVYGNTDAIAGMPELAASASLLAYPKEGDRPSGPELVADPVPGGGCARDQSAQPSGSATQPSGTEHDSVIGASAAASDSAAINVACPLQTVASTPARDGAPIQPASSLSHTPQPTPPPAAAAAAAAVPPPPPLVRPSTAQRHVQINEEKQDSAPSSRPPTSSRGMQAPSKPALKQPSSSRFAKPRPMSGPPATTTPSTQEHQRLPEIPSSRIPRQKSAPSKRPSIVGGMPQGRTILQDGQLPPLSGSVAIDVKTRDLVSIPNELDVFLLVEKLSHIPDMSVQDIGIEAAALSSRTREKPAPVVDQAAYAETRAETAVHGTTIVPPEKPHQAGPGRPVVFVTMPPYPVPQISGAAVVKDADIAQMDETQIMDSIRQLDKMLDSKRSSLMSIRSATSMQSAGSSGGRSPA
ncbi:hypothetical protein BC831DRAFT_445409 [Entophlyctis helioformis]|nr:hypothetical protein BC831DRAFT_445409 [Entophlyctis helioformis]